MLDDKRFVSYPFFAAKLKEDLSSTDGCLILDDKYHEKLCERLGPDYYTYLTMGDGCDFETVKVQLSRGKLYLRRGVDNTPKRQWPCGTCIEFHWTDCAMDDRDLQRMPEDPEEITDCGHNGVMCVGRWDYHFKNGWLSHRVCNNRQIPTGYVDGPHCYDKDGCLEEAADGSNRVAQFACK